MEAVYLPNLNALTTAVQEIRDELSRNTSGEAPELLFRGQADSTWPLTTTLERTGCESMSFDDYYRLAVTRVRPGVEAFTNVTWDVADYDFALADGFRTDPELFSSLKFPSVGFYSYMVYLRHHGFPSPLLDWTWSMHVAAFFAFRAPGPAERRSIYVYCERPQGGKGGAVGEPAMRVIGKYVRTHARHFRQQSDYTICAAFDKNSGGWYFHGHGPVFGNRGRQDYLWKFDLPSTERIPILKSLDEYNLNAFSLFDSQETLLETVWLRERVFEKGPSRTTPHSELLLPLTGKSLAETNCTRPRHPGAMMIAEESTSWPGVSRPLYVGGLGFGFKWDMGWMHDTLNYFSNVPIYRRFHHRDLTFGFVYAWFENFMLPLSHDEVVYGKRSLLDKMPGDRWQKFANLRALFGYMWARSGKKILFMGGEFGQWHEWNFKESLDWHLLEPPSSPYHTQLRDFVRDLNLLYQQEPALSELDNDPEGFSWIDPHDSDNSVISFIRRARRHGARRHSACASARGTW